jgi:hypothetical protein
MVLPQVRLDVQRMYLRRLYVPTNGLFSLSSNDRYQTRRGRASI